MELLAAHNTATNNGCFAAFLVRDVLACRSTGLAVDDRIRRLRSPLRAEKRLPHSPTWNTLQARGRRQSGPACNF
jgi:hypothetical protein